ncbi:hypothetical protein [uncultured Aeromicrobium sp.]|uniref:hypothetical protein n=1 Tax=uncultured Aeromicrobium sp. TaxID=337820 RepID=UPI0025F33292|nr:hypothetical protein [uncultured Aeromicrobium sp.]
MSWADHDIWAFDSETSGLDPFNDHNLNRRFKDPKTGRGYVYKLPALCERFKVPFVESHEACADAIGAARLARAFARKQDLIATMEPHRLFTLQKTACRAQKDSLRAYFDKQGKEHDGVDPGWPLHTRLHQGVLA